MSEIWYQIQEKGVFQIMGLEIAFSGKIVKAIS